jgi:hypothetical protein
LITRFAIIVFPVSLVTCRAEARPNIVVFLADDQGWGDLPIHGNIDLATPQIDSLAQHGAARPLIDSSSARSAHPRGRNSSPAASRRGPECAESRAAKSGSMPMKRPSQRCSARQATPPAFSASGTMAASHPIIPTRQAARWPRSGTHRPARDGRGEGGVEHGSIHPNSSFFTNWTAAEQRITWDIVLF